MILLFTFKLNASEVTNLEIFFSDDSGFKMNLETVEQHIYMANDYDLKLSKVFDDEVCSPSGNFIDCSFKMDILWHQCFVNNDIFCMDIDFYSFVQKQIRLDLKVSYDKRITEEDNVISKTCQISIVDSSNHLLHKDQNCEAMFDIVD